MRRHSWLLTVCCLISTVPAQWEPERQLTFGPRWSVAGGIAATGDTVHVVWEDNRTAQSEAFHKRSVDRGTTWSDDTQISSALGYARWPAVAVHGTDVYAAWCGGPTETCRVCFRRSTDAGATWEPETVLGGGGGWWPLCCRIAVGGEQVHVLWLAEPALEYGVVYYQRSTDRGMTWEPEVMLSEDTAFARQTPSLAVSASMVHVVWQQWLPPWEQVRYRRSTDAGASWEPLRWLTGTIVLHMRPSIASGSSALHLICEYDLRNLFQPLYLRSTDQGQTWSAGQCLVTESVGGIMPTIAADGENVHAAWGDSREVFYRGSSTGGLVWGDAARLSYDTASSGEPATAVGGAAVHVIWTDLRNGKPDVFYARNLTGNPALAEGPKPNAPRPHSGPTIVRGVLYLLPSPFPLPLGEGQEAREWNLLDISGRKVLDLVPGPNDVSGIAPGVYFIHSNTDNRQAEMTKLVVTR